MKPPARAAYRLFLGDVVEHLPAFQAKAVLLADVYVPPIAWGGTAYLSVWAGIDGPEQPGAASLSRGQQMGSKRTEWFCGLM